MAGAKVKEINLQALKNMIPEVREVPETRRAKAKKIIEEKPVLEDGTPAEGVTTEEGEETDENAAKVKGANWYVVHTYSGYENKVKANIEKTIENRSLQDEIIEVRVPMENVVELKNGSRRTVEKKLFPGYVLINMIMNDETWYVVRNTRGVTGFVGPESKPVPLTEAEVAALGVEKRVVEVNYEVGDMVNIIDGPLADYSGVVEALDTDKNYVLVKISMFGREIPTEFELGQVALAAEN